MNLWWRVYAYSDSIYISGCIHIWLSQEWEHERVRECVWVLFGGMLPRFTLFFPSLHESTAKTFPLWKWFASKKVSNFVVVQCRDAHKLTNARACFIYILSLSSGCLCPLCENQIALLMLCVHMCMPRSNNQIKSLRCGKTETDWNLFRTWKMRFEKRSTNKMQKEEKKMMKKQQLLLHMTLSVQSMSIENFAAFNKQAIKLTTATYNQIGCFCGIPFRLSHFDFYTITFCMLWCWMGASLIRCVVRFDVSFFFLFCFCFCVAMRELD